MLLRSLKDVSSFFAVARAAHMMSCAALAAVFVFERVIARRCEAVPRRGWIIGISLTLILISGFAWLAAVTSDMTGLPPSEALSRENLRLVLGTTDFGCLWQLRAGALVGGVLTWLVMRVIRRGNRADSILVWSVFLLGSLAWAGHGKFGSRPSTHLVADVGHLLIIAIWPVGLLPLWMMLGSQIDIAATVRIVNRFSRLALLSVAILIMSGWVNSWMLIASWRALIETAYGQTLLIKLVLLLGMLLFGAVNLIYLRPRIARQPDAIRALRRNVAIETVLAMGILLVVGYLGLLAPAADL